MTPKKKVLICGASGFIGRNIFNRFIQNPDFEVYGTYFKSTPSPLLLQHSKSRLLQADLTHHGDVQRVIQGMDVVIQAAATTSGANDIVNKPYYHVTDNAVMNSFIFRACFEHKVKQVVFFSCTVMYSEQTKPVRESDFEYEIIDPYFGIGWTKVYIEKMCEFYSKIGPTRYTAIRHSNIYGPYDKFDLERSHVFGATLAKVMKAEEGKSIKVWGTGEEKRDLLHVSDLVRLLEAVIDIQDSPFELFNVGSGNQISIGDLVEKIIKSSGKKLKIAYDSSKPTIKTNISLDSAKARKFFNWSPRISLEEGIKETIEWYKASMFHL